MIYIKADDKAKQCEVAASGNIFDQAAELCLGIRSYYSATVKNMTELPIVAIRDIIIASLEVVIDDIKESEV